MAVTFYDSNDASAPALDGAAGSLLGVLDACLVNGYGSKAAAGWTIAYTGSNQRVYTMASGGTGFSIFVDDSASGSGGGLEAYASGWKVATGLGTGTGQFPSTAQQNGAPLGALVIRKSATANTTIRPWSLVADGHTMYLFTDTGDNPATFTQSMTFVFGDFFSYSPTDASNCLIIGKPIENQNNNAYEPFCGINGGNDTNFTTTTGHYVAASWTNVGGPVPFSKVVDGILMGGGANGTSGNGGLPGSIGQGSIAIGDNYYPNNFPYPNGSDGALWMSPIRIAHNGSVRGYLKGLWAPLHARPLNHDDTFTVASGNLSGKSFVAKNIGSNVQSQQRVGQVIVETSNTWS